MQTEPTARHSCPASGSGPWVERLDPKQVAIYRRMTGAQRARIGFEISDFARRLALAGIRQRLPGASDVEVQRLLRRSIGP